MEVVSEPVPAMDTAADGSMDVDHDMDIDIDLGPGPEPEPPRENVSQRPGNPLMRGEKYIGGSKGTHAGDRVSMNIGSQCADTSCIPNPSK